jgi:hypothetical protein
LCLTKGNWDNGVAMLALGNDEELKAVATSELQGALSCDDQVKVADAWWEIAASEKGSVKAHLQERAKYWYKKALPGITGLTKEKVEKRLAVADDSKVANTVSSTSSNQLKAKSNTKIVASRKRPVKTIYVFKDESQIKKDWELTGSWRFEGEGLRLFKDAMLVSRDEFHGDFLIDVAVLRPKVTYSVRVHIVFFGESFEFDAKQSKMVRIQKTGDAITLIQPDRQPQVIKLKDGNLLPASRLTISVGHDMDMNGRLFLAGVEFVGPIKPARRQGE